MAERITRKQLKHDEFVEAAFDLEQWVEDHWQAVAAGAGGVLLVVLLVYGWSWWGHRQDAQTIDRLGEALRLAEGDPTNPTAPAGSWSAALPALEELAKSGSAAGGTAAYYRGVALMNTGRPAEAVPIFESLAAGSGSLADLSRAKLAWALADGGQLERALTIWREFAANDKSAIPTDVALFNVASLLATAGKIDEAKTVLTDLLTRFPQGSAVTDAKALEASLGGTATPPGVAGAR